MRANILRGLASQASKDSEFLMRARKDLEGTLIRYGYHLTPEEMRLVEGLRRQTAGMSGEELDQTLTTVFAGAHQKVPRKWPPGRCAPPTAWLGLCDAHVS